MTFDRLLTAQQVADLLGASIKSVRRWSLPYGTGVPYADDSGRCWSSDRPVFGSLRPLLLSPQTISGSPLKVCTDLHWTTSAVHPPVVNISLGFGVNPHKKARPANRNRLTGRARFLQSGV